MQALRKLDAKGLLIELAGIVFAVLLALWVDQWAQDREQRASAALQQQRIVEELRANLDQLVKAEAGNRAIERQNAAIAAEAGWWNQPERVSALAWSIQLADFKDASWTIALSQPSAQALDADFLAAVADLYKFQSVYERYGQVLLDGADDQALEARDDPQRALFRHGVRLTVLRDLSQQLEGRYRAFLKPDP